jgi:hypothetical protein
MEILRAGKHERRAQIVDHETDEAADAAASRVTVQIVLRSS